MNTANPMAGLTPTARATPAREPSRLRIRLNLGTARVPRAVSGVPPDTRSQTAASQKLAKSRRVLKTLNFGNIAIPYGRYRSGKVSYWMLFYRDGAKRIRESRVSFDKLKKRAEQIATSISNGQIAMSQFTEDQRADYRYNRDRARQEGLTLSELVTLGLEAHKKASKANYVHKTCPQILEELLAAKKSEGAGVRWINDLDSRLDRFATHFTGPLASLTEEDIRLWLARLNLGPRSWNNNRTALLALIAFARDKKYLPAEWDALKPIKPKKIIKPDEEDIYTPEEIRSLLFTAEKSYPQHLPTVAIMAFAGCRHCEMHDDENALDWKDIHFKTGQIHISEALAKNNTGRRYIPMSTNLVAWIEPYARPRGPVCTVSNLTNALARIADKAKIKWKQNGLRNSFISYRCAVTQNVAQVASEAGNSVSEIHKSYRKELTAAEGQAWFAIMPTRADVLPLFAHAKLS